MKTAAHPLRCLIVEDQEDDAKLLLRELRAVDRDAAAERVDTPEAMHAALARAPWDLVISDFSMPRFSGLDALKLLQASGHDLPFILVSGAMGEETAVAAMRAGAHDYLLKHDLARLGPAVQRELVNAAERRKRRDMEHALRQSNEALDLALAASNTGAWAFDLRTQVSTQSLIHDRMFGYTEAVEGWTVEKFLTHVLPEDRERTARTFREMFATESDLIIECRIRRVDGEVRWIHAQGRHERDEAGRAVRIVGLVNDITERKQTEAVDAFLSHAGVDAAGEPFFPALARFLAETLQMDCACIDRLESDAAHATPLAVWHDGRFADNLTYALKDTPCGEVVAKSVCCYPAQVCRSFPNDPALRELQAESCVGVTLLSHTGHPIGLIAVIGRQPLTNRALAETTLARVAPRAAGELERAMVEAALKASERRYRTLFSSMTEGFCLFEVLFDEHDRPNDLRFLEINPAFEAQCGLRDVLGKRIREVLPLFEEYWYRIYGKVVLTGEPAQFENEAKELNRWFSVSAYRAGDPAQRTVGVIFRDITQRRQAETALRESEERFKALADGSPLAIYAATGIEQNATYINPTFFKLFGYPFEEISCAAKWWPLAYPDEAYRRQISEDWHRSIAQAIATGAEVEPKEAEVVCKDGSRKTILWGFKTAGKENWTFGLDLTARKQAEATLLRQAEELRLNNDALIAARQAAERANLKLQDEISTRRNAEAAIVQQLDELRRWQEVMLDREDRVQELKREVNELAARLGEPVRYPGDAAAKDH